MSVLTPAPSSSTTTTAVAEPTRRAPSALRRLLKAELRLLVREPLLLTFVVAFPVIAMLIIGGSFGRSPDEVFPVDPAHWYVASYFAIVIGATGLITVPVHVASYRERGVLRRFAASGFPRWSFAASQLAVGLACIAVGGSALLAVAAPVYGIPSVDDVPRVVVGVLVSAVAFVSIGVLLGTLMPSSRSAQAVGLLLFFPSFLLGGGGPPPAVMSSALESISSHTPLAMATNAIREPWLGTGNGTTDLLVMAAVAVVAMTLAARRTAL